MPNGIRSYTIFLISSATTRACFAAATLPVSLIKARAALTSGMPTPPLATIFRTARRRVLCLDLTVVTRLAVTVMPFFPRASITSWVLAFLFALK